MNTDEEKINQISERIVGSAYLVHNVSGYGFSEKVYANALAHQLQKDALYVEREVPLVVRYDGVVVGNYFADMIVERVILVETKAVKAFDDGHTAQCLNYLAATGLPVCLLLNFARKVEIKRFRR